MNNAITQSMGLVTIFTMIFVAIHVINIINNPELKYMILFIKTNLFFLRGMANLL